MLLAHFPQLPDPITSALMARGGPAGLDDQLLDLDLAGTPASQVQAAGERLGQASVVVAAGLAATWLLTISGLLPRLEGVRMLALFPYLGVDAAVYGAYPHGTWWAAQCLTLARLPLLGRAMAGVAITPHVRGLEGVYAPRQLSWRHAAAAMQRPDFAALVMLPQSPLTVVLNRASPHLRAERAEAVLAVMNSQLELAFADPDAARLSEQVRSWASGDAGAFSAAAAAAAAAAASPVIGSHG